jgi:hypothetical protein
MSAGSRCSHPLSASPASARGGYSTWAQRVDAAGVERTWLYCPSRSYCAEIRPPRYALFAHLFRPPPPPTRVRPRGRRRMTWLYVAGLCTPRSVTRSQRPGVGVAFRGGCATRRLPVVTSRWVCGGNHAHQAWVEPTYASPQRSRRTHRRCRRELSNTCGTCADGGAWLARGRGAAVCNHGTGRAAHIAGSGTRPPSYAPWFRLSARWMRGASRTTHFVPHRTSHPNPWCRTRSVSPRN